MCMKISILYNVLYSIEVYALIFLALPHKLPTPECKRRLMLYHSAILIHHNQIVQIQLYDMGYMDRLTWHY